MHSSFLIETEQEAHRFWTKVTPTESGCWEWKKTSLEGSGYGTLNLRQVRRLAHRISYIWANGEIPPGMELDHLCRNRACCNPDHLEAVTHLENVRRGNGGKNKAMLTHCPSGHPYSGDNLFYDINGRRRCVTCKRDGEKRRYWSRIERSRVANRDRQRGTRQRKREAAAP